jgi:hypothetical protein
MSWVSVCRLVLMVILASWALGLIGVGVGMMMKWAVG